MQELIELAIEASKFGDGGILDLRLGTSDAATMRFGLIRFVRHVGEHAGYKFE